MLTIILELYRQHKRHKTHHNNHHKTVQFVASEVFALFQLNWASQKIALKISVFQDKGVKAVTTREGGGAAPHRLPVRRERETVTALMTAELTMVTVAVQETWCVELTTVSSLVSTITPRTTAVRNPPEFKPCQPLQ